MDVPRVRRPRRRQRGPRSPGHRAPDHGLTILDYLNEDCWCTVLDYVPVLDIIRSEPVCKKWQELVLNYLSHTHIGVKQFGLNFSGNHRNITLLWGEKASGSFRSWVMKLGRSVATYHCETEDGLRIIGEHCPNIKKLVFSRVPELLPPAPCRWQVEATPAAAPICHNFQCLQSLSFYYSAMSDESVSRFLSSNDLEELKFLASDKITGHCLINLKSVKLKRFKMKRCTALKLQPLLAVVDRLSELTKLVLKQVPREISDNAHLLFDKMPKLEYLYVDDIVTRGRECDVFFESVCKLRNLKFLHAEHYGTTEHATAVVRSCTELETLYLKNCDAGPGFVAACRHCPRLSALTLQFDQRSPAPLLDCIRSCLNLKFVSLPALWLSVELALRVAAARRVVVGAQRGAAAAARLRVLLHNDGEDLHIIKESEHHEEIAEVLNLSSRYYHDNDMDSDGMYEVD